jgi:hypothetical protein
MRYDLENLIKTFEIHSKEIEKNIEKQNRSHPDSDWIYDDFNISKAFLQICKEIYNLKKKKV